MCGYYTYGRYNLGSVLFDQREWRIASFENGEKFKGEEFGWRVHILKDITLFTVFI